MQGGNSYRLSQPVGWYGANKRRDVASVENLLGMTGHLDLGMTDGPTGYFGTRMDQAIKNFQKRNGIKVDGLINPGGETINALGRKLAQNFIGADKRGHIQLKPTYPYPLGKQEKSNPVPSRKIRPRNAKEERVKRALERARMEMKRDSLRILEDK